MNPIKVLVVDDSIVFRELLVQNLNRDPSIHVVGTAKDPFEARDAILQLKPDVMTLDIELPKMSGIEFLKKLMPQYPMPVVVISSLSDKVFDALNSGAVDFVAKPVAVGRSQLEDFIKNELLVKIKIASTAKISNIKKSVAIAAYHFAEKPAGGNRCIYGRDGSDIFGGEGIRGGHSRYRYRAAYAAGIYADVCEAAGQ